MKIAQDRAAAEIKAAQERYRADLELQLERERMASKERIAQIEAQARAPVGRGQPIDQEAFALRIRDVVDQSVRDALEDIEEEGAPAGPQGGPMDQTTMVVAALKEIFTPILPLVIAKLGTPTPPPLPEGREDAGGSSNAAPAAAPAPAPTRTVAPAPTRAPAPTAAQPKNGGAGK